MEMATPRTEHSRSYSALVTYACAYAGAPTACAASVAYRTTLRSHADGKPRVILRPRLSILSLNRFSVFNRSPSDQTDVRLCSFGFGIAARQFFTIPPISCLAFSESTISFFPLGNARWCSERIKTAKSFYILRFDLSNCFYLFNSSFSCVGSILKKSCG